MLETTKDERVRGKYGDVLKRLSAMKKNVYTFRYISDNSVRLVPQNLYRKQFHTEGQATKTAAKGKSHKNGCT